MGFFVFLLLVASVCAQVQCDDNNNCTIDSYNATLGACVYENNCTTAPSSPSSSTLSGTVVLNSTVVVSSGSLVFSSNSSVLLQQGASLVVTGGSVIFEPGSSFVVDGGSFLVNASGVVQQGGSVTVRGGGSLNMKGQSTFQASKGSSLTVTGGSLVTEESSSFSCEGSVEVDGGNVKLEGSSKWTLSEGSSVVVFNDGNVTFSSTSSLSITSPSIFSVPQGTVSFGGSFDFIFAASFFSSSSSSSSSRNVKSSLALQYASRKATFTSLMVRTASGSCRVVKSSSADYGNTGLIISATVEEDETCSNVLLSGGAIAGLILAILIILVVPGIIFCVVMSCRGESGGRSNEVEMQRYKTTNADLGDY